MKDNQRLKTVTIEREVIYGTYCSKLDYIYFQWMTEQEFYDRNRLPIKKYLKKNFIWIEFQRALNCIYSDIVEWD